jgi:alpha-glucosidase (family GH31 glycosyl hydrolase)
MVALHERFADTFKESAQQSVSFGYPIIRPLWWLDPNDSVTYSIDDQFMLGDEYMVAPVVTPGARHRDVYLTNGSWIDQQLGKLYVGPILIKDYPSGLEILPLFRKSQCNPCNVTEF